MKNRFHATERAKVRSKTGEEPPLDMALVERLKKEFPEIENDIEQHRNAILSGTAGCTDSSASSLGDGEHLRRRSGSISGSGDAYSAITLLLKVYVVVCEGD